MKQRLACAVIFALAAGCASGGEAGPDQGIGDDVGGADVGPLDGSALEGAADGPTKGGDDSPSDDGPGSSTDAAPATEDASAGDDAPAGDDAQSDDVVAPATDAASGDDAPEDGGSGDGGSGDGGSGDGGSGDGGSGDGGSPTQDGGPVADAAPDGKAPDAQAPDASTASTNIAPTGTGYTWQSMSAATDNSGRMSAGAVNDNSLTTQVDIDSNTGDKAKAWEAAGVVFSSARTVTSVAFVQGTTGSDGWFEANMRLQFSADGSTWTDAGWSVAPAYGYTAAVSGKTYTFTGAPMTGATGVRVAGQVNTTGNSWWVAVKEVQVLGY